MIKTIQNVELSVNGKSIVKIGHWALNRGKVYGLIGETGCGKSTLGKWLAGIESPYWKVRHLPSSGCNSHIDRRDISVEQPDSILATYLLQDAYQIFNPYVSIRKHFLDIWEYHQGHSAFESFDEIIILIRNLGIHRPDLLMKRRVDGVSQGEAQRLAFALSFIRPASIRIYDEIFANVDETASRKMLDYLTAVCKRDGSAAIIISHELALIREYSDLILTIRNEELQIAEDNVDQIKKRSSNQYQTLIEIEDIGVPHFNSNNRPSPYMLELPELKIGKGESVGLSGPSGVGKTTLLRGILGEHPLAWSRCIISDRYIDAEALPGDYLDIRYLPQSVGSSFNPAYRLKTFFSEIQSVRDVSYRELLDLVVALGLSESYLDRFPDELSGGEIQRMGIISVLMGEPDLILLDESFSSVDFITRENIWHQITQLQMSLGFAILVVSHDIRWLDQTVNRRYQPMVPHPV